MTVTEAAALFRVSESVILEHCRARDWGAIKTPVIGGGYKWIITRPPFDRPTLSTAAIARCLNCTERRVRQLCDDRRIVAQKIGRQWRVGFREGAEMILRRLQTKGVNNGSGIRDVHIARDDNSAGIDAATSE